MADKGRSYIVFVDETGFMLAPVLRRTWAPRGETPIIKVSEPHGRISVIGALALRQDPTRFAFYFHLLQDNANFNGKSVAKFVEHIRQLLDGPITLLWDEYCIHRAKPVKEYLRKNPSIRAEEFPPYAPELNPVDYVWSYVKYGRLANYCPHGLPELRQRITAELASVAEQPRLLRGLFSRTGLRLED
ncbi:MAG: IS630 family transposase [Planctomycetes bacterium]|nr:IS630 family transposase [Planctomycetota bacterium]